MTADDYPVYDALDELVAYMDDMARDYDEPNAPHRFIEGYEQARHDVRDFQLMFERGPVECDCDDGGTGGEQYGDGSWRCPDCGVVLIEDDHPPTA